MVSEARFSVPSSPKAVLLVSLGMVAVVYALQVYDVRNEEKVRRRRVERQAEALRKSPQLTDEQFRQLQQVRPLYPGDLYVLREERWETLQRRIREWLPGWSPRERAGVLGSDDSVAMLNTERERFSVKSATERIDSS
jgi:hypothetical protein